MNIRNAILAAVISLLSSACGGGSSGGSNATPVAQAASQDLGEGGTYSCWSPSFAGATTSAYGSGVVTTTGNFALDQAISEEIQEQTEFWTGVPANVYLFNEGGAQYQNAYSSPQGYIMLGEYIMLDVAQFDPQAPLLPTTGVLAHEWGHQVQFDNGWQSQNSPTAAPTELEADMFSGFYMAYVQAYTGADISGYFAALGSLGNYDFTNPQFHGTPEQRESAAATGYETAAMCAEQLQETGESCGYSDLHAVFVQAVNDLGFPYSDSARAGQPAASEISARARYTLRLLDSAWISGIARGDRRLAEKGAIPVVKQMTKQRRLNSGPHF